MNRSEAHHRSPPPQPDSGDLQLGLTAVEYIALQPTIEAHHQHLVGPGQCSSLNAQRIRAPAATVWSVVRRFDLPQIYKHFIRSCAIKGGGRVQVGCLRDVSVISGLPGSNSIERLDILDDEQRITGFTIIGGEHRLRNYRSVRTVTDFGGSDREQGSDEWTVVLESYIVDVPEGNTENDTRVFADTVVRLNLQKLASVSESMATGKGIVGKSSDG
ncbi:abscisic acid receptor PYR1-like [Phalaenopsis equestris]|uniref:abscisic acid receptor PYR1-like n=1 Tax=Phalaenopsis equestris TaxID=78828 RepID=UPI0009E28C23|nr:abscisic acid receptor PYR1-like [Phalaenopsis equestris]